LLVRVKRNQPTLHDTLAALCDEQRPIDQHATVDRRRHGRQEHRLTEVFEVAGRLSPEWQPLIACMARISRLTWTKDTRSGLWKAHEEVAYYAAKSSSMQPRSRAPSAAIGALRTETITFATASSVRTVVASGASRASSPVCARSRSTSYALMALRT
jgi:hypothetical protein